MTQERDVKLGDIDDLSLDDPPHSSHNRPPAREFCQITGLT